MGKKQVSEAGTDNVVIVWGLLAKDGVFRDVRIIVDDVMEERVAFTSNVGKVNNLVEGRTARGAGGSRLGRILSLVISNPTRSSLADGWNVGPRGKIWKMIVDDIIAGNDNVERSGVTASMTE